MVKYLQLMLIRAIKINACTNMKARTRVYAKASYKNTVYTTTLVEDMGQNPVFAGDGTNVCHFVYENEAECITLELFNRNHTCIGNSKLSFTALAKLKPEQDPEVKTLPVLVASGGYSKAFGELIVTAQIKQQKAEGEQGNLHVVLKQGNIKGLISIFARTTRMNAKLTYKHTTLASGSLEGMGNKFMWHADNTFTFIINSSEPGDVLEIEVYNGSNKVGECKIQMSLLITGEEGLRADPTGVVTRTADLLVKNKNVGSIEVAATFTKTHIGRRNSYPQDHAPPPPMYPPCQEPHLPIPPHLVHHKSQPMPNTYFGYPTAEGSPSSSVPQQSPRGLYPPEQPHLVQPGHIPRAAPGPYEPSAPSAPQALYPPVYSSGAQVRQAEAHGAPAGKEERKVYFQGHPEIATYVNCFH